MTDHVPVLPDEVLALLGPLPGQTVLDGTVGAGGHAERLAQRIAPGGTLYGADLDPDMLALAASRLASAQAQVRLLHYGFDELDGDPELAGVRFDAILLDLGFSSAQMERPERGLSFREEGPLDMRLDRTRGESAADLLARLDETELADLLWRLGEERRSRRIARAIVREREREPIATTTRLAEIVRRAVGGPHRRIHPATRSFQALRIATNDELGRLERGLPRLIDRLAPGGRIAVISFHSLEDRIAKRAFLAAAAEGRVELLTKKPVRPGRDEVRANRRSRSAKLRAARRIAEERG